MTRAGYEGDRVARWEPLPRAAYRAGSVELAPWLLGKVLISRVPGAPGAPGDEGDDGAPGDTPDAGDNGDGELRAGRIVEVEAWSVN